MARLEDGGVVFLAADEEVDGVYLADVEDGVDGDLDCGAVRAWTGWVGRCLLNSATPRRASGVV